MSRQQVAILFDYPERAAFGRVVPKTRIEAHGRPGRRVRDALTAEVARIVWQYKLAPETVNLPARTGVPEIQNLRIELKAGITKPSFDVLRCIDRAIASPIIFECQGGDGMLCTIAAYKRPSEADRQKWVIGDYFVGVWTAANTSRQPLPVALDLAGLYTRMLRQLMPWAARATAKRWRTRPRGWTSFADSTTNAGASKHACTASNSSTARSNSTISSRRSTPKSTALRANANSIANATQLSPVD
jgi:hypothetical protein